MSMHGKHRSQRHRSTDWNHSERSPRKFLRPFPKMNIGLYCGNPWFRKKKRGARPESFENSRCAI